MLPPYQEIKEALWNLLMGEVAMSNHQRDLGHPTRKTFITYLLLSISGVSIPTLAAIFLGFGVDNSVASFLSAVIKYPDRTQLKGKSLLQLTVLGYNP